MLQDYLCFIVLFSYTLLFSEHVNVCLCDERCLLENNSLIASCTWDFFFFISIKFRQLRNVIKYFFQVFSILNYVM